ncbi:RNA recognition motif-containing protein [Borealophlyctis nickersoniae]|nr:RNA recognition motif-containing protein [Borealophlyctis nickersoniae]
MGKKKESKSDHRVAEELVHQEQAAGESVPEPAAAEKTSEDTTPASTDHARTTLFVTSLPYTATSEELQSFFSEIGPVRSCFVVADPSSQDGPKNKGYGYVTFALPEDAERALKELKKAKFQGKRTLRIELALKKKVAEERKAAGPPAGQDHQQKSKKKLSRPAADGAATAESPIRKSPKRASQATLEISGLPEDVTKKQIYKKARKHGSVVEVVFPVVGDDDAPLPGVARVVYATNADAAEASKHLDDHQFKGVKIHAKDLSAEAKEAKKSRLIVRNLAWACKEEHLRKAFKKFGTITDCKVPQAPDGKARGFGFVQFATVAEAEKAIDGVNGTEILKRTVAVDWSLPKAWYDRSVQENPENGPSEENGDTEMAEASSPAESAESAESAEEASEGEDEDEEEEDEDEGDSEWPVDSPGETGRDADSDEDDVAVSFETGEDDEEEDDDEDDDEDGDDDDEDTEIVTEKATKGPRKKAESKLSAKVEENCTLFVRNLSFETTQEELNAAFSAFGPLRYARVTMDRTTGRSRGTGFVCFFKKEDADNCMSAYFKASQAAAAYDAPSEVKNDKKNKKDAPSVPSILNPEPSLTAASTPFVIGGRFVNLSLAISKNEAQEKAQEGKVRRRAEDKRNLYLMREGVIFPDSPAAANITPSELSKRQKSYAERKRILATNPNLFISRTRLSIRNLNLKVDDKELKKVAKLAVKKFWEEVEKGEREGLEQEVITEEEKLGLGTPGPKRKYAVKQAKIQRSKDRMDATTKQLRSLGYGFVEFESHADALACLRWLNNNPRAFAPPPSKPDDIKSGEEGKEGAPISRKRPIVEFAIENLLVLKRRAERVKQREAAAQKKGDGATSGKRKREDGDEDEEGGEKRFKSVNAMWKERKQKQRERKEKKEQKAQEEASGEGAVKANAKQQKGKRKREEADNEGGKATNGTAKGPTTPSKKQKSKTQEGKPSPSKPVVPPTGSNAVAVDEEKKKRKKKAKVTKAQRKDEQDEAQFSSLVQKYKKDLFAGGGQSGGGGIGVADGGIKRWFT